MAHINYVPRIRRRLHSTLESTMPMTMGGNNFAAFSGSWEQRLSTGLQAMARYCGRCGIVVLHNNSHMDQALARLPEYLRSQNLGGSQFQVISTATKNYDPLYGLEEDSILNLLAPYQPDSPNSLAIANLRSGLSAYLAIIRYHFRQNSRPFGRYPFTLDLLCELTRMPYATLRSEVLAFLPRDLAAELETQLDRPEMQQNIYAVVGNFASLMSKFLWTSRGFQSHSRISITQAVESRQLISIRLPDPQTPLLDYLETELRDLTTRGIPYLLISDSLALANHSRLRSRFFSEHIQQNYFTGILADSVSSVTGGVEDIVRLFSQYHQIFVYRCSSVMEAQNFTDAYGTYLRWVRENNTHASWMPLHLLPAVGDGTHHRETPESTIRPEELTHLYNGVLLCGRNYPAPNLIRNYQAFGGVYNGTLLP